MPGHGARIAQAEVDVIEAIGALEVGALCPP